MSDDRREGAWEWGIKHNQGVATFRHEGTARAEMPIFRRRYEESFRNKVEPRLVRRWVGEWQEADQ